jgi:hypothetical protein
VQLKDPKDVNPIEVAEYAIAQGIDDQPAFSWWVPAVIKYRSRTVAKLQKRYWHTEYKFGIQLPKTVEEALKIDHKTASLGKSIAKRNAEGINCI